MSHFTSISVLEPSLFLFYINDMPEGIQSTVRLFADDTIAYVTISSDADAANLQQDLDKLAEWKSKWLMKFHPEKCNVLTISKIEVHLSTITLYMDISSKMIHQQNTWDGISWAILILIQPVCQGPVEGLLHLHLMIL
jgi:hypothetical protein